MAAKGKSKKNADSDSAKAQPELTANPNSETEKSTKRPRRTPRQRFIDDAQKTVDGAVKGLRRVRDLASLKGGGTEEEWDRILGGLQDEIDNIKGQLDAEDEPESGIDIFGS